MDHIIMPLLCTHTLCVYPLYVCRYLNAYSYMVRKNKYCINILRPLGLLKILDFCRRVVSNVVWQSAISGLAKLFFLLYIKMKRQAAHLRRDTFYIPSGNTYVLIQKLYLRHFANQLLSTVLYTYERGSQSQKQNCSLIAFYMQSYKPP